MGRVNGADIDDIYNTYDWTTYPFESNWQYVSIGSDNGLAANRRQAIIWTNDSMFVDAYMRSQWVNMSNQNSIRTKNSHNADLVIMLHE